MQKPSALASLPFYFRYSVFQLRDRFSDLGGSLGYLLLYPFFIWLLTQVWGRFNAYLGHYTRQEIYLYVSLTELLFLTFLRSAFMQRSAADFSLAIARPRSWLALAFAGQIGATLGGRILYGTMAVPILFAWGVDLKLLLLAFGRLILMLPLLGIIEALMAGILASTQLIWHETRYLMLPITKIFLALGGVFAPLADYGEPGRSIFLKLPASDLFFQVGHFCVKGTFYRMTTLEWVVRIVLWSVVFFVWNKLFFHYARKRHQSFGG